MARSSVKDKRKQQLINATVDSIAKRGLTETTITHISKGAKMSRGIINFYFSSKEMMMRDVLKHLIESYESVWERAKAKAGATPQAQLEAIVHAHFDRLICSPKRLNVMSAFWGHAATHEAYRTQIDASDEKLQQELARLWEEVAPGRFEPKQFARQLHALMRGLWLSYLMAPKGGDRDGLAAECLDFIHQHQTPLRVVKENKPKAERRIPTTKKAKPVEVVPAATNQMSMDDLFAQA